MEFTSTDGEQRYAELVKVAGRAIVGLDFDGTLSPIVDDPERAHIHDDASDVLLDLAREVAAVAVITGRPARQVLDLGGLEEVGDALASADADLYVFGQYGNERWSSQSRRIVSPRPPRGLASFERELTGVLRRADAAGAWIEDKGLAVAVHTRRLPDADAAFRRLLPLIRDLAQNHELITEPGRNVIEVRSSGMHKGLAVRTLVDELDAGAFLFAGDDLGDMEAFEAVAELRAAGMPTLLVCSASAEESALVPLSDVVVKGPEGVLDLLRQLTVDAGSVRPR
ncbi:trehalose-phosphatase [Nocardioides endophyticus]|uniref:Trehalose 6-phosphate phosphatase n=1 Tax=Nocardioides endophyticus TaxID=1353775 RepID=A0ABP8YYF2_9ACTN